MAIRAENRLSCQSATLRTDEARAALAAVEIDLADATTEAQVGNPKARRRALEWQAVLQAADG